MDKKKIALTTVGIAVTGLGVLYLISGMEPQMYSGKWFDTISDELLKEERENIRKKFCSAGSDYDLAGRLQKLLWRFDKEISKRAWAGEVPTGPSYHREHGFNLYKPD